MTRYVPSPAESRSQLWKMYSVQGEGPAPTDATYHLHQANGIGPHRLRRNGSHRSNRQEARSAERVGGRRSLHPLCAGICHQKPYGEDNGPGAVQQLLLCVWFSPNVSCRIKEQNSVGRSLRLCAACSA